MSDLNDPKAALKACLQMTRDALVWKLDGLSERDARLPRTPTGTNLPDYDWPGYVERLTALAEGS